MIDFIKANVSPSADRIFKCAQYFTYESRNVSNNIAKKWKRAEIDNMIFLFKDRYVELRGSLHKFKNSGKHNADDFIYEELVDTIICLCDTFDIDPKTSWLQNLEFGVNISVPFDPTKFLKEQIISYKWQPKTVNKQISGRGWLVEFEKTKYIVKIYDKGAQYNLNENILRFEIKSKRSEFLKSTSIKTIEDLKIRRKLHSLKRILYKTFNNILIIDPIDEIDFNEGDKSKIIQYLNPNYLQFPKPIKTFYSMSKDPEYNRKRKKYYRERKNFKKLLVKYNLETTKKMLFDMIVVKCDQLIPNDEVKEDKW